MKITRIVCMCLLAVFSIGLPAQSQEVPPFTVHVSSERPETREEVSRGITEELFALHLHHTLYTVESDRFIYGLDYDGVLKIRRLAVGSNYTVTKVTRDKMFLVIPDGKKGHVDFYPIRSVAEKRKP